MRKLSRAESTSQGVLSDEKWIAGVVYHFLLSLLRCWETLTHQLSCDRRSWVAYQKPLSLQAVNPIADDDDDDDDDWANYSQQDVHIFVPGICRASCINVWFWLQQNQRRHYMSAFVCMFFYRTVFESGRVLSLTVILYLGDHWSETSACLEMTSKNITVS